MHARIFPDLIAIMQCFLSAWLRVGGSDDDDDATHNEKTSSSHFNVAYMLRFCVPMPVE